MKLTVYINEQTDGGPYRFQLAVRHGEFFADSNAYDVSSLGDAFQEAFAEITRQAAEAKFKESE